MRFFSKYKHIVAAMSERSDGSMGNSYDQWPSGEYELNRRRFLGLHGINRDQVVLAELVHGANVATVFAVPRGGSVPDTDGLVSMKPAIAITTADCFPVFFSTDDDPDTRVIGLAHAGWRSILAGIVRAVIEKLEARGADVRDGLLVAVGPGIRSCCFVVRDDENGISRYRDLGYDRFASAAGKDENGGELFKVDLAGILRHQLSELGVPLDRIEDSGQCTFCDQRFISWRRDHIPSGNMLSVIQLRGQKTYEKFIL